MEPNPFTILCIVLVFDVFKEDIHIDKYINMFPKKRLFINIFAHLHTSICGRIIEKRQC